MGEVSRITVCKLCLDFGRARQATVRATVPMCGERPRYPLCQSCLDDLDPFAVDVEPIDAR